MYTFWEVFEKYVAVSKHFIHVFDILTYLNFLDIFKDTFFRITRGYFFYEITKTIQSLPSNLWRNLWFFWKLCWLNTSINRLFQHIRNSCMCVYVNDEAKRGWMCLGNNAPNATTIWTWKLCRILTFFLYLVSLDSRDWLLGATKT